MIYFLSESEKKTAIKEYAGRQKTIRQLAQKYGVLYEIMRRIMVNAGYSNGLKVRGNMSATGCLFIRTAGLLP